MEALSFRALSAPRMSPLSFDSDVETVVGNGRLIARATASEGRFVFAGPAQAYRLALDGEPLAEARTVVRPGRVRYETDRGAVTLAAQPDAVVYAVLVEGAGTWTLALEGDGDGVAAVWAPDDAARSAGDPAEADGPRTLTLSEGGRGAFLLGDAGAVAAIADPFEAVEAWAARTARRGLRLRTPAPDLDRAVEFAKAHLVLGYDWTPDADGAPGGEGSKLVCDVFRWRDVWSRDFGSGFGPGGIAAGLIDPVLATLDYEAERYGAHPPARLKVSDDTSQGGSAEALGWVLKLVWRVFKHTGDRDWLARIVPAFEPWVEEWIARDADDDGLVADVTEWMDHSRFLRLPEGQRTLYSNVLYFAALRRMAYVCDALGRPDDAERYLDLSNRSRQSIHDAFWNEAGYFDNAVMWGVPDTALMLADNALAVVEKVASRNERYQTLRTIRERLWRTFGTITVDPPMRYLQADNDHNGKVWPWWMALEAKARFQAFDAEGGLHVLSKIVDTFARPTLPGLCEEYLEPDTGEQDDIVGHAFITGSGALLDAVQYGMLGLSVREPGERTLRLAPAVPRGWETWGADVDLVAGRLSLDQTADGLAVALDATAVETLELRVPPREAVDRVVVDGAEVEPERVEDGASLILQIALAPGQRHTVEVAFAPQRVWNGQLAMPPLPPPAVVARPHLMDDPRLFAPVLQDFVRSTAKYFGAIHHVGVDEIDGLAGEGDWLILVGNELPYRTKGGASVPDAIDGLLARGGSMLLLGPRFPRIDITAHYHRGAQMGEQAGMFWWKLWEEGVWRDYSPRLGETMDAPDPAGTVYWGGGPLFQPWEHQHGLFGFETDARGVFDADGTVVVDAEHPVGVVYTDWSVRKPWSFTPLAFTQRTTPLVTGPRTERYPCAALLANADTGARIVVVAPSACSRPDLLHEVLGHVAVPG